MHMKLSEELRAKRLFLREKNWEEKQGHCFVRESDKEYVDVFGVERVIGMKTKYFCRFDEMMNL